MTVLFILLAVTGGLCWLITALLILAACIGSLRGPRPVLTVVKAPPAPEDIDAIADQWMREGYGK